MPKANPETAPLSPWQVEFASRYGGGDYAHVETLADVRTHGQGDTLFIAAMVELDKKEGCTDSVTAVQRLDSMIEELEAARRAITLRR